MNRRTAVAVWLACSAVAVGQIRIMPRPMVGVGVGNDDAAAKEALTVYVRDSGVAAERLQLAERLEGQKQWDKAADVLQEVAQKYGDRVVPARTDADGKVTQYVSATQAVQDRLAKWPPEGLAAYRQRYEGVARDLLTADPSEANAGRVTTLYFATDAGRDAALRVMSGAFERSDFVTAASVGRRLLDGHPGLAAGRPRVLVETGVAEHLAGRDADAKTRLDELKTKYADALVTVGGADVKAAENLQAALAAAVPPAGRYRSDDWPSAYGTPDAAAVPESVTAGGARLFSIGLPGLTRRGINAQALDPYKQSVERDRKTGASTGILPSVDNGTLFFQDNARVWAVSLASGVPLPGWQATYSSDKSGTFSIDADPTPRNRQTAVSVTPDSVIALLGQYDAAAGGTVGPSGQPPQIVCLDRATGRLAWKKSAREMRPPDAQLNLREGVFYGTPVVDDTNVYTLLYANRGGQFDECYLVALDSADGSFKWASYVASTASRGMDFDGSSDSNTQTTATLSMAGGRLYVATNLGAVACLDAADGRTIWLNLYTRMNTPQVGFIQARRANNKPFAFGPPVVADGRVFVLPTDSPSVLIYDAADGTPVREIKRRVDSNIPEATTLVGVVDDALVLMNRATIFRLPWKTFDPNKSLIDNGGRSKNIPPAENDHSSPTDSIRGRPFISGKAILVPSAERLYRLSLSDLTIESQYPTQGQWDDEESPGNVLATPDNLILAGPTRVTAYADLGVATGKLDARLAADAGDIDAYLRYAELLLAAGQTKAGIDKWDQAADRLGGRDALPAGPQRDRLFEIAAGFALKLQRADAKSGALPQLYDRAAAAAVTPSQQVRYRLGRAALDRVLNKPDEEIALHQEILANADWRSAPAAGKTGASTAGAEAASAVADLLRLHGAGLYAPYEEAAEKQFDELKQTTDADPATMLAIAEAYPSAKILPDVLTLAAERFEAAHQPRRASQTLRKLLAGDLSNDRRQSVLQALARNSLRVPNQAAVAQVRLRQAAGVAPEAKLDQPLLLPDGTPLKADTVAAAVVELDGYRLQAQRDALPTLGVPKAIDANGNPTPAFKPATVVAPATAIVNQQADAVQNNRVVVCDPAGKIGVVAADSGQASWTECSPPQTPTGCGFVGDTLVVVAPTEVSGVDPAGHVRWRVRSAELPVIDVTPAPGSTDTAEDEDNPMSPMVTQRMIINGQRVIINNGNRRVIRIVGGRMPVMPPPVQEDTVAAGPGERFTQFRLLSDRVVLATNTGRVMAVDTADGRTAWQTRVSDNAAGKLLSNDDFVVASFIDPAGNAGHVYVFDAQTGQTALHRGYDGLGNQPPGSLANVALSPDGVLVTLLGSRLIGQDLYDAGGREWKYDWMMNQGAVLPFAQSTQEGQLVIAGDRVLAVHRSIGGTQSVRAFDLRTLKPLMAKDQNGHEFQASFGTGDNAQMPVTVQASGRLFYAVGEVSLGGFDLDRPAAQWFAQTGAGDRGTTRDVILAKDFVLMASQVAVDLPNAPRLPAVQLSLFSRAIIDSKVESGALEQRPTVQDPATILAGEWQAADGAFFYVSGDQKLKVLRANR